MSNFRSYYSKKHTYNNSVLTLSAFQRKKMCVCIKQLFKPFLKAITFVSVKIHIMALKKIFSYKFDQQNKTANCELKQS